MVALAAVEAEAVPHAGFAYCEGEAMASDLHGFSGRWCEEGGPRRRTGGGRPRGRTSGSRDALTVGAAVLDPVIGEKSQVHERLQVCWLGVDEFILDLVI